ncbi:MAG TPA: hypothetical protein VF183_07435, partial [Acidimicrobiales bacterium]
MSLRLRVIVGFAVVVGLLAVTSLIGVSQLGSLEDHEATIARQEAPFIVDLQRAAIQSRDANNDAAVILVIMVSNTLQEVVEKVTGTPAQTDPTSMNQYKASYQENLDLARASFASARTFVEGEPDRLAALDEMEAALTSWDETMQRLMTTYEQTGEFDNALVEELNTKSAAYHKLVDDTIAAARTELDDAHD